MNDHMGVLAYMGVGTFRSLASKVRDKTLLFLGFYAYKMARDRLELYIFRSPYRHILSHIDVHICQYDARIVHDSQIVPVLCHIFTQNMFNLKFKREN